MADDLRAAAYLAVEGDATVTWRTCFSTNGSDEPTGIAPMCLDEDHEEADGSVYDCCPDPVIETGSGGMAAYLVDLLNTDIRHQAAPFPAEGGEAR